MWTPQRRWAYRCGRFTFKTGELIAAGCAGFVFVAVLTSPLWK